jgi:hypothetical protein
MRRELRALVERRPLLDGISHVAELAQQHSRDEWMRQLRASLGVDITVADPDLRHVATAFRRTNTDQIQL